MPAVNRMRTFAGDPEVADRNGSSAFLVHVEPWHWVAGVLTAALGLAAYGLLPFTGMTNSPSLGAVFMWLTFFGAIPAVALGAYALITLARGRRLPSWSQLDHGRILFVILGYWLVALNLTFFGMLKPQLAFIVPFSADLWLADLDQLVLGGDAWTRLGWFNHSGLSLVYHEGWFVWLAIVVCAVMLRERSREKSQLLVTYFLIWSLLGPLVHLSMPAAGPVFFDDLGLGSRFEGIHQDAKTQVLTAYLLDGYLNRQFNPGGGISAMPSVHLATMAWTMLALRRTPWLPLAVAFTLYILFGSVVLGWHYLVDGLVGMAGGGLCYVVAGGTLRRMRLGSAMAGGTSTQTVAAT